MAKRNLTIQMEDDVIRQARVVAARRGTSVSGLVAKELADLVAADTRYEEASRQARALLDEASPRGGRSWTRAELHER